MESNSTTRLDFENLSNDSNEKAIIIDMYNKLTKNKKFKQIDKAGKQEILINFKHIISDLVKKSAKSNEQINYNCINLLNYTEELDQALKRIDKKLKEKNGTYEKFRTKFSIKKILADYALSGGSLKYAILNDDTESLSRGEVLYAQGQLRNFLDTVTKYLGQVINYSPLIKFKKDIINNIEILLNYNNNKQLNDILSGATKTASTSDDKYEEVIRNINTNVVLVWENSGYKKLCSAFRTLDTEQNITRKLRKTAKITAKWIGPALAAYVAADKIFGITSFAKKIIGL